MGKKSAYAREDDDHSDAFISSVVGGAPKKGGASPREQLQEERSEVWTSDIYYRLDDGKGGKGGHSCLSIFVLVFSAIITLVGLGLLVLGIVQKEHQVLPLCPGCNSLATGLDIAGAIVILVGLVGVLASVTRRKIFAVPFTFLIAILGILFLVLGAGAIVYDLSVGSIDLQTVWTTSVRNDPALICSIESNLQCSGFSDGCCRSASIFNRSSSSYYYSSLLMDSSNTTCYYFYPNGTTVDYNNTVITWPGRDCAPSCTNENTNYVVTCNEALRNQIKKYLAPIAAVLLGLGVVFLVLGGQAICMTRKRKA